MPPLHVESDPEKNFGSQAKEVGQILLYKFVINVMIVKKYLLKNLGPFKFQSNVDSDNLGYDLSCCG